MLPLSPIVFISLGTSAVIVSKDLPLPALIPISKYRERRQHWVLCVDANGLIWMLNVLQPPCSLLQCISSLRVYDPSLSASNVQKHLLLFFMSKTVMWILKYIFTNEKKNPSRLLLKNELGEGDAALNVTSLFWFGVGFFCFVFSFPPSLMKFLKMRWAVVAIETSHWQKLRLQIYSCGSLAKLDAIAEN